MQQPSEEPIISDDEPMPVHIMEDLRFGYAVSMYDAISRQSHRSQLDALHCWFGDLFIDVSETENEKKNAAFDDQTLRISAVRFHGRLHTGDDSRLIQIIGRLYGTAKGNQEKERRSADLIRRAAAKDLIESDDRLIALHERIEDPLLELEADQLIALEESMIETVYVLSEQRQAKTKETRQEEAAAMDDEVFRALMVSILSQATRHTLDSLILAWMWTLLGSFLRNETGRLLRYYDAWFVPVNRPMAYENPLIDQLDSLVSPEAFEPVYYGDDLDKRFPGIVWRCDRCGDSLDAQEGFSDKHRVWQCLNCGYLNRIAVTEIYETESDFRSGGEPMDPSQYIRAIRERTEEVMNQIESEKTEETKETE